jgi:hypothetical protein
MDRLAASRPDTLSLGVLDLPHCPRLPALRLPAFQPDKNLSVEQAMLVFEGSPQQLLAAGRPTKSGWTI